MDKEKKLKGLSIFSSAGLGETYIDKFIDIKVANELLKPRSKLYSHFYPNVNMINGDITKDKIFNNIVAHSLKEKINFIYSTPPCQSFSKAGKQESGDERDILFLYIIKLTIILKPKYILIENVPEFIKLNIFLNYTKTNVIKVIKEKLQDKYKINYGILNTADYGTHQTRKRSIILLSLRTVPEWVIPPPTSDKNILTIRNVIGHLPSLESGERSDIHKFHFAKKHNNRHILWMSNTPTGKTAFDNKVHFPQKDSRKIKGYRSTYKRMYWDKPSATITMTNGSISSQNNVHPGKLLKNNLYSDARVLTIYELMLLSGLPDNWDIPDWASNNLIRQVIGECVPPLLIKNLLENLL